MITLLSLIMSLFLGGVITGNILGDMRQKAAGIVFYSWKGIQVFRKYVDNILNPRSDKQVSQRNKFLMILRIGQDLLLTVIHPFWKSYAVKMSEINAFMSTNIKKVQGENGLSQLELVKSNILMPEVTVTDFTVANNQISLSIDPIGNSVLDSMPAKYLRIVAVHNAFEGALISSIVIFNKATPLTFTIAYPDTWINDDATVSVYIQAIAETITDSSSYSTFAFVDEAVPSS